LLGRRRAPRTASPHTLAPCDGANRLDGLGSSKTGALSPEMMQLTSLIWTELSVL